MSIPQGAEISLAYADFLSTRVDNLTDIRWGPAYSTGTRVLARDARGVWRAYLISDLTAPKTVFGTRALITNKATASGNAVSTGIGFLAGLTPTKTGNFLGLLNCIMSNDTVSDGMRAEIRYNTSGVPALGADATPDSIFTNVSLLNNASISGQEFTLAVFSVSTSPLVVGTKYYFYISFLVLGGGGTTTMYSGSRITMVELTS